LGDGEWGRKEMPPDCGRGEAFEVFGRE